MEGNNVQPKVIINADDLGIHPDIDKGIVSSFENGLTSSASLLLTMPHSEKAARSAFEKSLPIGVHLDVFSGKSFAGHDRVPLLTDESGNFNLSNFQLLYSCSFKRDKELIKQISIEFELQFQAARDMGTPFTHFDSHNHVHMFPGIYEILVRLAPKYGFTKMRRSTEPWSMIRPRFPFGNLIKWAVLKSCRRETSLRVPEHFVGLVNSGRLSHSMLIHWLRKALPGRTYEIGVHPGFQIEDLDSLALRQESADFISQKARQEEHDALTNEQAIDFAREHTEIISFGEL